MGGLYSSANLDQPAFAKPIHEPDFSNCRDPVNLFNKDIKIDEKCCLLPKQKIIKYAPTRIRRAAHNIKDTDEYVKKYERAITLMKLLPEDDPRNFNQQAKIHCAYCNLVLNQEGPESKQLQIHKNWLFFPWHRWYLYFYERILAHLIDDPTFALPYWNWDNPEGMTIPPIFLREGSQLAAARRDEKNEKLGAVVKLYGDPDKIDVTNPDIKKCNLKVINKEMAYKKPEDFYGVKYSVGSDDAGDGSIERGSHTQVHVWVGDSSRRRGEDMGNFYSAGRDPLFFSHHANVDRMWKIWCDLRKKEGSRCFFEEGGRIDPEWGDATFLFFDENKNIVSVKVADALDNEKMGYSYEDTTNIRPWLEFNNIGNSTSPKQEAHKKGEKNSTKTKKGAKSSTKAFPVKPEPFPVTLEKTVRVSLSKPAKADFVVLKNIEVEEDKLVSFEVYVNSSSDNPQILDKEYLGCYSQLQLEGKTNSNISLLLADVLTDCGAQEDEKITVSLVPKVGGKYVKIGGIGITSAS